jgi:hypothetical protein
MIPLMLSRSTAVYNRKVVDHPVDATGVQQLRGRMVLIARPPARLTDQAMYRKDRRR